jgi:DNA topoisomerase IA
MKNIEQDKLETLLQIIAPAPALRIAHFCESGEKMVDILGNFCSEQAYEYQINCTEPSFFEALNNIYKDHEAIKPIKFTLERPRYMIQGKLYEYLFVTSTIPTEMRSDFLKKTHGIIKNAGLILIFIPKGDSQQRYNWIALLEEHYYVASSTIDDLFEHYDVIISKKMHGWGG